MNKRAKKNEPAGEAADSIKDQNVSEHVGVTSPKGKIGKVILLLRRPEGAGIEELIAATGWQAHSVRGAMSGALKKKLGLAIASEKTEAGRIYRITSEAAE